MGSNEPDKPLRRIGASFEELATVAKQQQQSQPAAMVAGDFSRACSHVSVLFGCLGIASKFAEMDYVAKKMQGQWRRHEGSGGGDNDIDKGAVVATMTSTRDCCGGNNDIDTSCCDSSQEVEALLVEFCSRKLSSSTCATGSSPRRLYRTGSNGSKSRRRCRRATTTLMSATRTLTRSRGSDDIDTTVAAMTLTGIILYHSVDFYWSM